jgi:hypothetical protein
VVEFGICLCFDATGMFRISDVGDASDVGVGNGL